MGVRLPTGQRLMLKAMALRDIDVWIVWESDDGSVEVGVLDKQGEVRFVEAMPRARLARKVAAWWASGLEDR
jgi:hypothetical protein